MILTLKPRLKRGGASTPTEASPQIPQPIQAASVDATAQPQPAVAQTASSEPVAEPAKA